MHTITAQDLKHMWDRGEDFLLVNTLPAEHFAATKIQGAVNISQAGDDFAQTVLQRAGSVEKTIVVYCAHRLCDSSTSAAQKLLEAGMEDVWSFEGGAEEWQEFQKSKRAAGASKW